MINLRDLSGAELGELGEKLNTGLEEITRLRFVPVIKIVNKNRGN